MAKLQVVKCNCGDNSCIIHGLSSGNFPQGAGFHSEQEAQTICDAVNNTAGKGIDPNSIPALLQACKNALADLAGIMPEYDPNGERIHSGWKTIQELKQSILAAKLK